MSEQKTCRYGLGCRYLKQNKCRYFHAPVQILKREEIKKKPAEVKSECKICNELAVIGKYDQDICEPCREIRTIIFDESEEKDQVQEDHRFYKNVVLVITYDWTGSTHSGYCSDPGKSQETKGTEKVRYPLLNSIYNEDLDDDLVLVNKDKLRYYEQFHTHSCCGRNSHTIHSAIVKRRKREIDLLDEE